MTPPGRDAPADLDTPLIEVTFVVLDVETTGGSPDIGALTEVGAVRFRAGSRIGTFDTLVDPCRPVPPFITDLTGISDRMLWGAPKVHAVLPLLVEFIGDAVLVGHNVEFDLGFLDAALAQWSHRPLTGGNPSVDTLALARRLVSLEVPDCSLGTLAGSLGLEHQPCHRALADALATADLLHCLLEEAAGYGVASLGDLLAVPERLPVPDRAARQAGVGSAA